MIRSSRKLAAHLWVLAERTPGWLARLLRPSIGQLELRLLGRMLVLAAFVGIFGGLVGAAFVGALDRVQALLLDQLAGSGMLRAHGEPPALTAGNAHVWLLALLPALGGLASGLLSRIAPEIAGGGADTAIATFHRGGQQRPRVLPLKWLASLLTLGTGGAGGREGPALHMGSAIGGMVGSFLPANPRERRVLLITGMAAGMSAVFRTPLGAALLSAEVVYRDDFEAESVVPAVISSGVAFATSEAILGQRALFGRLPPYPFHAAHLPLYFGLAVIAGLAGLLLIRALKTVRAAAARIPIPAWARPVAGGVLLGVAVLVFHFSPAERFLGVSPASALLGGGYGLAQLAVTPAGSSGWAAAGLLVTLALLRIMATSLTVGSGASAGDLAPSLVLGALVGGAYGHAAQALLGDPSIAPGAFALVGMGTLFAGVAHVPVSAVVLVSELAGSYDLLVPLMLAAGGAHVALRGVSLYGSQASSRGAAPPREIVEGVDAPPIVRDVMAMHGFTMFVASDPFSSLLAAVASGDGQVVFPVVDPSRRLIGLIDASVLLETDAVSGLHGAVAANLAGPPASVEPDTPLRLAVAEARRLGVSQLPVCQEGRVVGMFSVEGAVRLHAVERRGVRPIGPSPR
jgi:CIC family chloride channel protein